MAKQLILCGLDPSLSNFGMVKGSIDLESGHFDLTKMELTKTAPIKAKKKARKNSEDLHRARDLFNSMTAFLKGVDMVFVEIPVGSQTARAMASYGICIGVLASIGIAMIQVTPAEVKIAATGNKTASKADMIDWATNTYPKADWLHRKVNGEKVLTSANEHLADATAAIHAGVATDEFQQARTLLK